MMTIQDAKDEIAARIRVAVGNFLAELGAEDFDSELDAWSEEAAESASYWLRFLKRDT